MAKVQVVDSPCGAGKTTWASEYMNAHPEKRFIYCTPYLNQLTEVKANCRNFRQPLQYQESKKDNFNFLLAEKQNIMVTHATFLNAVRDTKDETMNFLKQGNYTLIMDEVLDVVADFNEVQSVKTSPRQGIEKGDICKLKECNFIEVGEDQQVQWTEVGVDMKDWKYSEVKRYACSNQLYCVDSMFLIVYPPEMFQLFDNVYILTYIFDGCDLKYYFQRFGIEYDLKSVCGDKGNLFLEEWSPDVENRMKAKRLIHVFEHERMNNYEKGALSRTWYNKKSKNDLRQLRNNLCNYFRRQSQSVTKKKIKRSDMMWTCFKDNRDTLKGPGYANSFVPCNAKALNDYNECWVLAYCINVYCNPMKKRFFTDGNHIRVEQGLQQICPDDDAYALYSLLQWVYRSRIRNSDLPDEQRSIWIYLPSYRMRKVLSQWMDT